MPLNTEVDYNSVVIKGTVELGVKGERGLQGLKGDQGIQGIQGPPVPVAHELGDDPDLAVSQKLLTDSIADKVDKVAGMGLSELSFTTDDKNSLDQSEQDRHTHANKSVIDDLSDNAGALEYRGLPVSDQAALDAKVDKAAGYSLVADDEIAKLLTVEQDAQKNTVSSVAGKQGDVLLDKSDVGLGAVDNTSDTDKPVSTAVAAALAGKVDKVVGKQLSDENYTLAEKEKLSGVAVEATKNRADSENADKEHTHAISDVTGLSTRLSNIDALIGDVESALIIINGEP